MCGIPAKQSRDRPDNGLLIDVPRFRKKDGCYSNRHYPHTNTVPQHLGFVWVPFPLQRNLNCLAYWPSILGRNENLQPVFTGSHNMPFMVRYYDYLKGQCGLLIGEVEPRDLLRQKMSASGINDVTDIAVLSHLGRNTWKVQAIEMSPLEVHRREGGNPLPTAIRPRPLERIGVDLSIPRRRVTNILNPQPEID
jgi:hypothetical protein